MSEKSNESRLPPPAFPPGSRKHLLYRNSHGPEAAGAGGERDEEAYISPDEPLPARRDPLDRAFISPDEPLPERRAEMADAFRDAHAAAMSEGDVPGGGEAAGDGEVVGMDMDPHLRPSEAVSRGDPHVEELMTAVAKLAESVRRKGEAGLRATPDMSRFEATLRAYCVGFLAGRRAEDAPPPEFEEALPTDG